MSCCAIAQVETDQALVGNADFIGKGLEVIDRGFVEQDRDLLIEQAGVRILAGVGEIVFVAHGVAHR